MGKIKIWHGVYDIIFDSAYNLAGFFHDETKEYLPMANKLKMYLLVKGLKFYEKYGLEQLPFTLARDSDEHIETVAVCSLHFDAFEPETGEDIVVGRIRRMRGNVKKIIFDYEKFEKEIKLYDMKAKGGRFVLNENGEKISVYKTIIRKRLKLDAKGLPIVRREVFHKPYNLDRRYKIKHKDGTITDGELMYPYIYKLQKHSKDNDHQSIANMMIDSGLSGGLG